MKFINLPENNFLRKNESGKQCVKSGKCEDIPIFFVPLLFREKKTENFFKIFFPREISLKFIVTLYFIHKNLQKFVGENFYFCKISRNLKVKFFTTFRERDRKSGKNFIF